MLGEWAGEKRAMLGWDGGGEVEGGKNMLLVHEGGL